MQKSKVERTEERLSRLRKSAAPLEEVEKLRQLPAWSAVCEAAKQYIEMLQKSPVQVMSLDSAFEAAKRQGMEAGIRWVFQALDIIQRNNQEVEKADERRRETRIE